MNNKIHTCNIVNGSCTICGAEPEQPMTDKELRRRLKGIYKKLEQADFINMIVLYCAFIIIGVCILLGVLLVRSQL